MRRASQNGFTIVELLIVIVVIGILAAITIVAYNGITGKARIATMQSDLSGAATTLEIARTNSGTDQYPADLTSAGLKSSNGDVLNYQVNNSTNPASYCLTVANSGITYNITNSNTNPTLGSCTGVMSNGTSCPPGFIDVPGNPTFSTSEFCVMKYEAKQASATVPVSQAANAPWVSINQTNAISYSANVASCSGCHLITEAEWMTIAANVLSVASNWSGGSVGSGYIYRGHSDNTPASALAASTADSNGYFGETNTGGDQRRTLTLTNGEVIWDFAGNVWEWTNATVAGSNQPGLSSQSGYNYLEWNNGSLAMRGLPTASRPGTISGTVGGWSSSQGIGQLYSYYGETATNSFLRGGTYFEGTSSGILALNISGAASNTSPYGGFRVTK